MVFLFSFAYYFKCIYKITRMHYFLFIHMVYLFPLIEFEILYGKHRKEFIFMISVGFMFFLMVFLFYSTCYFKCIKKSQECINLYFISHGVLDTSDIV